LPRQVFFVVLQPWIPHTVSCRN